MAKKPVITVSDFESHTYKTEAYTLKSPTVADGLWELIDDDCHTSIYLEVDDVPHILKLLKYVK